MTITQAKDVAVIASTAVQEVFAQAAGQTVAAFTTGDLVIAGFASDLIVTRIAIDGVIAALHADNVRTPDTNQSVGVLGGHMGAPDDVVGCPDGLVHELHRVDLRIRARGRRIEVQHRDAVCGALDAQHQVAATARHINISRCDGRVIHDAVGPCAIAVLIVVVDHVLAVATPEHIQVSPGVAVQGVIASTAVQDVVTLVAHQAVLTRCAIQRIVRIGAHQGVRADGALQNEAVGGVLIQAKARGHGDLDELPHFGHQVVQAADQGARNACIELREGTQCPHEVAQQLDTRRAVLRNHAAQGLHTGLNIHAEAEACLVPRGLQARHQGFEVSLCRQTGVEHFIQPLADLVNVGRSTGARIGGARIGACILNERLTIEGLDHVEPARITDVATSAVRGLGVSACPAPQDVAHQRAAIHTLCGLDKGRDQRFERRVLSHGLLQGAQLAVAFDVREGLHLSVQLNACDVCDGVRQIGREPHVDGRTGAPVDRHIAADLTLAIAVAVHNPRDLEGSRDGLHASCGQREQLAFVAEAVLVEVSPDTQ